ncbi:hypothetical protein ACLXNF_25945 [Mycobacteroides chelonae]|uniref:hypothetical protein n=1 Tax=Mycobacteroides chelonae TaxID=1774 RepID=UPI0039EC061F
MSHFEQMYREITGDSWLDNLARASIVAAAARFDGVRPPHLAVDVNTELDAQAFAIIASSVQDAVARVGRHLSNPSSNADSVLRTDRERARLFPRRQMGRRIEFAFENPDIAEPPLFGERTISYAERAALELADLLPENAEDVDSVMAIPARERANLNAIKDLVTAVQGTAGISLHVVSRNQERHSVLTADQARTINEDLSGAETESHIINVPGRLDGVRTRRRVFYFEAENHTYEGGFEQELATTVKAFLDEPAVATLRRVRLRRKTGSAGRWAYNLLALRRPDEVSEDELQKVLF